ncbi:unnamed protein product [Cuscuta campestris]|uniref:Helitron helicase-like domain-containing protein n=1 Tax=Cuscuta campestris TaxID=132261 RepID=A0A484KPW9_9ASTE|nr:unnamed protein product [Cuscuta campestris]
MGPDRVTVAVTQSKSDDAHNEVRDETEKYYDCRYVSACEASWRILSFDIHHRWPAVLRLNFHLPGQKFVTFKEQQKLKDVSRQNLYKPSMFEAWMIANSKYKAGENLTYAEFPGHFVFNNKEREWHPRKQRPSIGRLQYMPAGTRELYYLRILLTVQRGCTSYESLKTVNNVLYNTFEEACDAKEFIEGIKEAAELGSGNQLRKLFVTLLVTNTMSRPQIVWEKSWERLVDGILFDRRRLFRNQGISNVK